MSRWCSATSWKPHRDARFLQQQMTTSSQIVLDVGRRKFLVRAVQGLTIVGAAFTAVPFIESWLPSESARALGGPVEVDVDHISSGQMIIVNWRRKPIYIVR